VTDSPTRPGYRVLTLHTAEQRRQAAELYRSVFGYDHPSYGINPRLLAGLTANGGSVVGALDPDDRLVGFAYGFLGSDGTDSYHYSQSAVVAADLQGQGVGRRLKLAQREVALRSGCTSMRWAYDPMLTRNAHFNLDVLGACGIAFKPDLYDEPGTDRILIDWDLTREPGPAGPAEPLPELSDADWGRVVRERQDSGDRVLLALPRDIAGLRISEPQRAADLRATVREVLGTLFAEGLQAVSCRAVGPTACYIFRQNRS
jgi:predicted GNAT superfamily acetyltransferase